LGKIAMIAVFGGMLGGVFSFLVCLVVVDLLARWSQRPIKGDLKDVIHDLEPEPTPLMKAPHASFGFPPHGYTNRDWRMRELKERCREE